MAIQVYDLCILKQRFIGWDVYFDIWITTIEILINTSSLFSVGIYKKIAPWQKTMHLYR